MRVFVTGASSDIGLGVCRIFLSKGWDILAHYKTPRAELEAIAAVNSKKVELLKIDFDEPATIEERLAQHKKNYSECDVLINCAAFYASDKLSEITAESIFKAFSVNVLPGLLLMRDMGPEMARRKWGRIIHLSSIGVKFGGGSESYSYALSKHALEFLPADYRIWASNNTLLNILRVGVTNTRIHLRNPSKNMTSRIEMIPTKRMADTSEIAKAVWFFGSEENSYITGQIISISGGE
jgi:NAD(P)-dependent dehydrogenase (short-subunit alcohol dehydrogenase family)